MSRDRAQDWGTNDNIEIGYLENSVADKREKQETRTKLVHQHLTYQRELRPQKAGEQKYQALKAQNPLIRT